MRYDMARQRSGRSLFTITQPLRASSSITAEALPPPAGAERDPGVSDAVWYHTVLLSPSAVGLTQNLLLLDPRTKCRHPPRRLHTPPTARTLPPCLVLAHNAHMRGQPTCRVSGPRRALHDGSFRTSRSGQPSVIGHQDMRQAVSLGPETLETPVE